MRVVVFEQFLEGHHSHYLSCFLPSLVELSDQVVVAIPSNGKETEEFRSLLAPFDGKIAFDDCVPPADPRLLLRQRGQLFCNLLDVVEKHRPDYVLVPTADAQTSGMVSRRLRLQRGMPQNVMAEGVIHFGLGLQASGAKAILRDRLKLLTLRLSTWRRIHFVNCLFYERAKQGPKALADRAALLPDPIPPNPGLSRAESRERLGLPREGRFVGLAASLDKRKAIPELLTAFRAATNSLDDRILLAGRLCNEYRTIIDRDFSDLVKQKRLLVIDRFLSRTEFLTALTALDIVCTPYPNFGHLSGTLLHGVAAGRPILANNFGWSAEMVKRFQLGWACDVLNPQAFSATLREALAGCLAHKESPKASRLRAFHSPANFAHCLLAGIRSARDICPVNGLVNWDWVLNGVKG